MTQQLPHHVRRAFDALHVTYDGDDLEYGIARLHRRAQQRRNRRIAAATAIAIALIAGSFVLRQQMRPTTPVIILADGTRCLPRNAESHVAVVRDDVTAVLLRVDSGAARFIVAKQHGRRFDVVAGDVTVRVVGTIFDVERIDDSARVSVSEGKVEVRRGASSTAVAAGETWTRATAMLPLAETSRPQTMAEVIPAHAPSPRARAHGGQGASVGSGANQPGSVAWRALARSGDYSGAFAALKTKGSEPPRDSAEDLFLAADSARLSGHPAEALIYLDAIVDRHANDARADLAAFTLGRIYLDDLQRPAEAARSFAMARRLAPQGELAEDALAREVEAWRAAGDDTRVRDRGHRYLETYPHGQRVDMVRRAMGSP